MKKTMTVAFAALILSLALAAGPKPALAAFNTYLTTDGGGGEGSSSGSNSSGVGGSTLTGWFVQLLDSVGIR